MYRPTLPFMLLLCAAPLAATASPCTPTGHTPICASSGSTTTCQLPTGQLNTANLWTSGSVVSMTFHGGTSPLCEHVTFATASGPIELEIHGAGLVDTITLSQGSENLKKPTGYSFLTATVNSYQGDDLLQGSGSTSSGFLQAFYGGSGTDSITMNAAGGEAHGGDDWDLLYGGAGIDYLYGDEGGDYIVGRGGDDYLFGSDTTGSPDPSTNLMYGGAGNDHLYGNDGDDLLIGFKDAGDTFDASSLSEVGADVIEGGDGADTIDGGAGDDVIDGGDGNDTVYGGEDLDIIDGGQGNDELYGGAGNDIMNGGSGKDLMNGGTGNDEMNGGNDNDRMCGQEGNDTMHGDSPTSLYWSGKCDYVNGGTTEGDVGNSQIVQYVYGDRGIMDTCSFGLREYTDVSCEIWVPQFDDDCDQPIHPVISDNPECETEPPFEILPF